MQRLWQRAPDPQREGHDAGAQRQRDAPAISGKLRLAHHRAQPEADQRAYRRRDLLASALPAHRPSALVRIRGFHEVRRCRAHFAAKGEALDQPRDHRDNGRCDADRVIARRQHQQQDAQAHQHHAEQHGGLAPVPVRISPQDEGAERPGDEARAESPERGHQAEKRAFGGKEGVTDLDREEGVSDEIVEFEPIADRGGDDGALLLGGRHGRCGLAGVGSCGLFAHSGCPPRMAASMPAA